MEFVLSQKGERKVIYDGFVYVFQNNLANDLRSFECRRRRKGEEINEHIHLPSQPEVEILRVKSSIKRRAETTHETGQQILAGELQGLSEVASVNLPSMEHLRRTIRSQRHEHNNRICRYCRYYINKLQLANHFYYMTVVLAMSTEFLYSQPIKHYICSPIQMTGFAMELLKCARKYFSNFTPSTQKQISVYFPVLLLRNRSITRLL